MVDTDLDRYFRNEGAMLDTKRTYFDETGKMLDTESRQV